MTWRERLASWKYALLGSILVAGVPSFASEIMETTNPPNVVVFLADDLGWADVGFNNPDSFHETPNIDRLAQSGMIFKKAYAAAPVCSPTRAAILAGKHPARLRTTDFFGGRRAEKLLPAEYLKHLPLEEVTLAEALREGGFRTAFFGKWHLGETGFLPEDQGFDVSFPRKIKPPEERFSTAMAADACRFIEESKEKPFFAYLCFNDVHLPFDAPPDRVAKYEKKLATWPRAAEADRFGREGRRDVRLVQEVPVYAAMVEELDAAVGMVLKKLNELNLAEDTIVVFTSDNGGVSTSEGFPTSNAPLRAGKGWLYEGGLRVPLVIRAPGRTIPGSQSEQPVISMDIYPTILDLCGLPPRPEQHMDGVSLVKMMGPHPQVEPRRAVLFWHYPHYGNQGGAPSGAIRVAEKKLIEFFEDGRVELYDLQKDPSETHDLAPDNPKEAEAYLKLLRAWRKEVGAAMPTENPDFDDAAVRRWHEEMNKIKQPAEARVVPTKP